MYVTQENEINLTRKIMIVIERSPNENYTLGEKESKEHFCESAEV